MSSKVQVYVYDQSNGLARQLSRMLTGKQIDGVWHTTVVVFGKEVGYGYGILVNDPGHIQNEELVQVIDVGDTAIDQETFNEYLDQMRDRYMADKYHLLEFNCNTFTEECVNFLTGKSIPPWIQSLPSEFLSTPIGEVLKPIIDGLSPRSSTDPTAAVSPQAVATAAAASPNAPLAAMLLQTFMSQYTASRAPSGM